MGQNTTARQGDCLALKIEQSHEIMRRALREHQPLRVFAGFSGGGDSSVLAAWAKPYVDSLFHIDTGTGIPGWTDSRGKRHRGVREHVEWMAAEVIRTPLVVYEANDAYRRMVIGTEEFWATYEPRRALGVTLREFVEEQRRIPGKGVAPQQPFGFPGPGSHGAAYTRLKERQFDALRRDVKAELGTGRSDRVMMLTGVRRSESARRANREEVTRRGSLVFVSPLTHWTASDMQEFRERHALPRSDVSALIEMSGECTCGAFADEGEREMLMHLWPEWWAATHGALEHEAAARGLPLCVWGKRYPGALNIKGEIGPFCAGCEIRQEVAESRSKEAA